MGSLSASIEKWTQKLGALVTLHKEWRIDTNEMDMSGLFPGVGLHILFILCQLEVLLFPCTFPHPSTTGLVMHLAGKAFLFRNSNQFLQYT